MPDLEINTNTAPDNNPVHEAVQFYWGERCPEHEDGCPTCEARRQYDDMMQGKWAWHEAKAREYNLMVDDMVRPRIDPEIQNTMLKIILERDVKC